MSEYFSVNKVINRIITTLNAYDSGGGVYPFKDKCHNRFGSEPGNFETLLKQNEHIYIFYGDEELNNPQTNYTAENKLWIEFWVIDQYVGVDSSKSDYQADNLRKYLLSSNTGWRSLGIEQDYPNMNSSPYFVQSISPVVLLDDDGNPTGYLLTVFRGYIRFDSSMR